MILRQTGPVLTGFEEACVRTFYGIRGFSLGSSCACINFPRKGDLFCSSSLPQVKGSELGIQCKLHETGSGSDRDFGRLGRGIGPQVLILGEKMLYLLRGAADKGGRIQ